MTDQEKFLQWHQEERKKGLVDIKFFVGNTSETTTGGFYAEANQINDAESIETDVYRDNVDRVAVGDLFRMN